MDTILYDEIVIWMENNLNDFHNFKPFLFTDVWIHLFCESRNSGKEYEIKYDKNNNKLFMRYLEPSEIDDDWICIGNIKR